MESKKVKIILNHVGFIPGASKVFAVTEPEEKEFIIYGIWDELVCGLEKKKPTEKYRGKLRKNGNEISDTWTGDFSKFTAEGTYRIHCGGLNSRCFIIYKDVYSTVMRTLFNHFSWARCGNTVTGWASPCHLNDGIIVDNGEKIDLEGGYHQSSDLRKWSFGLSLAMVGLTNYALLQEPSWNQGQIEDELKWGSNYFLKLMREDGGLIYSNCLPHNWEPREYFLSDSPPPDHWNTIRFLSLAGIYFKDRDIKLSKKYLEAALKVWGYMLNKYDSKQPFSSANLPKIGHEAFKVFYQGFYEGSAVDLAHKICAANNLYKLSGDRKFLEYSAECGERLIRLNVLNLNNNENSKLGALFWESADNDILANSYMYFWYSSSTTGLCDLIDLIPDHPSASSWKNCIDRVAESYTYMASKNPWGLVPSFWFTEGNNPFEKYSIYCFSDEEYKKTPRKPYLSADLSSNTKGSKKLQCFYYYNQYLYNIEIAAISVFLCKAYRITENKSYLDLAQRQLDWITGFNPFDSSSIEAVGYNQPHRGVFGEFFPPTPQIPGAVSIGVNEYSFDPEGYGMENEYDLPVTAMVLWAFAELVNSKT